MGEVRSFLSEIWTETKRIYKVHKKGIRRFLLISFPALFVLGAIGFKASEKPWFCGVCHNMTPYVDSWKVSSHKDASCIDCHYEPGFINHLKGKLTDGQVSMVYFLTGKTPGKYHAEISDKSCLQCHELDSLTAERNFRGVSFSHPNHLETLRRGKKLRCTSCHGQIVQGQHITVDIKDCFVCHFKPEENGERHPVLSACDTCHKEVPLQIEIDGRIFHHQRYIDDGVPCLRCHQDIIVGDGAMIENKCVECHNEPTFITDNYSAEALHLNHVTEHKVECWHCHREIKHEVTKNPTAQHFDTECLSCHQKNQHLGPREMYKGVGGIGVADSPAVMYKAGVDCASCHRKDAEAKHSIHSIIYQELAMGESCNECHGHGYDSMLLHWQEVLMKEVNDVNLRVFDVQKLLFAKKGSEDQELYRKAQRYLTEARHNLNFVLLGRGHHNIEYALKLLNFAKRRTEQTKELLVPEYKMSTTNGMEYSCATLCHTEMETREVKFGSTNYPHKAHIKDMGLDCESCHSSLESHGQTRLELCKDCHHGDGNGNVSCQDCHSETADLFAGKGAFRVKGKPSFKFGKVECVECHQEITAGENTTREKAAKTCVECHEEGFDEVLDTWDNQVEEALAGQQERLDKLKSFLNKKEKVSGIAIKAHNLLLRVEQNLNMVKGRRGLHNPDMVDLVAKANATMMDQAENFLTKGEAY